jgi:hypothetical protein
VRPRGSHVVMQRGPVSLPVPPLPSILHPRFVSPSVTAPALVLNFPTAIRCQSSETPIRSSTPPFSFRRLAYPPRHPQSSILNPRPLPAFPFPSCGLSLVTRHSSLAACLHANRADGCHRDYHSLNGSCRPGPDKPKKR